MSNSAKKHPNEKKIIVYAYAKLANVSTDIRCTICSKFLTRTHSVPECLHRICGDCVDDKEKSLKQYTNECPSCRYHIPIKQFLRPDETFDKMVYTIRSVSGLLEDTVRRSVAERADAKKTMNSIDEAIDSVGRKRSDDDKRRKMHSDDEKRRKMHSDALRTYQSTIHEKSLNGNTDERNHAGHGGKLHAHRTNPTTIHEKSLNGNTDGRNQAGHDGKKQMTWDNVFDGVLPPGV